MSEESPSIQDRLAKLPRRSIVAFAVRCARRVQPLLINGETLSRDQIDIVLGIHSGLSALENWCSKGGSLKETEQITAIISNAAARAIKDPNANRAAAEAAKAAEAVAATLQDNNHAEAAARAFKAARVGATKAAGGALRARQVVDGAAIRDLEQLEQSVAVTSDGFGGWIDPTNNGPLGSIWGDKDPSWYSRLSPFLDKVLVEFGVSSDSIPNATDSRIDQLRNEIEFATRQAHEAVRQFQVKHRELNELQLAFDQQTEAVKKQEEVARLHRDQFAKQQEFTAQLQLDLAKLQVDLTEQQRQRVEAEQLANELKRQHDFDALRTWGELVRDFRKVSWSGIILTIVCLTLVVAAICTFMALSEISSRQQYELLLTSNLTHLRDELAKHPTEANDPKPNAMSNQQRLELYEQNLQDIRQLVIVGAYSESHTLAEIAARTNGKRAPANPSEATNSPEKSDNSKVIDALSWWSWLRVWVHFSSEFLLAMVVVACGTIGALIAAMRTQGGRERLTSRALVQNLVMGFSAGFITFFAVRGGKSVFLLHGDAPTFTSNPYTTGFLGLIAGLFTDRAYTVLMKAVDELQKKIEQVITSSNGQGGEDSTPSPTSKPKPDAGPAANEPNKPA